MSRPQSGIKPNSSVYSHLWVFNVIDLPMNAMSVSQFSVMVPGLASELMKMNPGNQIECTVGFGQMFWILVWHTGKPHGLKEFEDLEIKNVIFPGAEGDLLIYVSSNNYELIEKLGNQIKKNLNRLTEIVDEVEIKKISGQKTEETKEDSAAPPSILIGADQPDFTGGTFLWVQKFSEKKSNQISVGERFHKIIGSQGKELLIHSWPQNSFKEEDQWLLAYNPNLEELEDLLIKNFESALSENCQWLEDYKPVAGWSFFVPSLDVLIGLRMGGIRMNRFSTTQQFKIE